MEHGIIDPHFHIFDIDTHPRMWDCLAGLGDSGHYLPEDYKRDFELLPLAQSVFMEVLPTDPLWEVEWVESLRLAKRLPWLGGIVAACCPARRGEITSIAKLPKIVKASPLVKGIRWIMNWGGELAPEDGPISSKATWPRVDSPDFSQNPLFRQGYGELPKHGLSFDLQINSHQIPTWAQFAKEYPGVPVVLDHIANPRWGGTWEEHEQNVGDPSKLAEWEASMKVLASVPHACVKLSMLDHGVPGWQSDPEKEKVAQGMFRFAVREFGSERCMVASNFPVDRGTKGPEDNHKLKKIYDTYNSWFSDLPDVDRRNLFHDTAKRFYRLEDAPPSLAE